MVRELSNVSDRSRPRVGIVGGGQLAQMMVQAAIPLDVDVRVLARRPDDSAASVARDVVVGDWHDPATLDAIADGCDAVTFDHELVTGAALRALEARGAVLRPSAAAMAVASDKVAQRRLAARLGVRTPTGAVVTTPGALRAAVADVGLPVVLKSTRGGYDGRGVRWLATPADVDHACEHRPPTEPEPLLVEPRLTMSEELAVVVARGVDGATVTYPVVHTEQVDGICVAVTAPAATDPALAAAARDAAVAVVEDLGYVGVLAVEYFVVDGALVLNELAPRPHNSGHYTIDACVTSQFENHLRAVLGRPLGDPSLKVPAAVMANVIAGGTAAPAPAPVDTPPGARVHLYGKAPRPGRKIGHVTVCGDDPVALRDTALSVAHRVARPPAPRVDRVGSAVAS